MKTIVKRTQVLRLMGWVMLGWSAQGAHAQTNYTENFTSTTTANSWYFINGACLTMGTYSSASSSPSCKNNPYYNGKGDTNLKGGDTGTLPDATSGALRFTNTYDENGAILSNFNFPLAANGMAVSFTTVTYEGNSGGSGGDGADGINFFLQDATYPADVGAFGGSLGYTCSNVNYDGTLRANGIARGYDGLQGGYIGLGIDEYGNFLNAGDNTATGWGYVPGRIGMRGPGSITWASLNAAYPIQYPSTLSAAQKGSAVQHACQTGKFQDWSSGVAVAFTPTTPLPDYAAINGAYKVLPTSQKIAYEAATLRSQAIPITYNVKITTAGLLSLSYSYNGGALQNVITNQDITNGGSNPLPTNIRFGFAGSTGGSTNIHEVMCFQATPQDAAQSSASVNQKQSAKIQTGTQLYFAYYNPVTLAGSITSQYLTQDATNPLLLDIDSTVNWDGSCVLTGVPSGQTCDTTGPAGPIPAEGPTSRTILSWDGAHGVPFEWANLSSGEQTNLDAGDPAPINALRLNYLRGDRSQEQTPTSVTTFSGLYRTRTSVLGDIIDSSPTWVGPPTPNQFPDLWSDSINAAATMPENSGEAYSLYASTGTASTNKEQQRTNVVFAGANDGMLHGFRTGSFDSSGNYIATYNDGREIIAFMPGQIVNTIQTTTTLSGVTVPNSAADFSDPQYGHHFDVDATPGTGELFYGGVWHTWLIGGLGPGGSAIYALDITDPDGSFTEANAANVVKGEWTSASITCLNSPTCGTSLGKTYGTPVIRRFHNGSWGAVFGNGLSSTTGDAGLFVMLVDPSTGAINFYYISAGNGTGNGIAYASPADLDGDHIVDYVYAGDLKGNLWRFDLTSSNPASWTVGTNPVYTTPSTVNTAGVAVPQPITTKVLVAGVSGTNNSRLIIEFGTGQQKPMTNSAAAQYSTSPQALYGIWDWNMASWNAKSTTQFASLPNGLITAPTSPIAGTSKLQQQTMTYDGTAAINGVTTDVRSVTQNSVCYADSSGCTQYGWYLNLAQGNAYPSDPAIPRNDPAASATANSQYLTNPVVYEQIVFNPTYLPGSGFLVNTVVPAATAATTCFSSQQSGWSMALDIATGGALTRPVYGTPTNESGAAFGATGTTSLVNSNGTMTVATIAQSSTTGVYQTASGKPGSNVLYLSSKYTGRRVTWIERR